MLQGNNTLCKRPLFHFVSKEKGPYFILLARKQYTWQEAMWTKAKHFPPLFTTKATSQQQKQGWIQAEGAVVVADQKHVLTNSIPLAWWPWVFSPACAPPCHEFAARYSIPLESRDENEWHCKHTLTFQKICLYMYIYCIINFFSIFL